MRKFLQAGVCGLMLFSLAGCSRESDVAQGRVVTIEPMITRVEGLNFEVGDEIGLTISRPSGIYADNVRMSYDGSLFKATDLMWYEDSADPATLVAYYPYSADAVPTTFRVATDQSLGIEDSDLLAAVKSEVSPTAEAVGMVFKHMMASVRIVVTNESKKAITGLKLGGTHPEAEVDLMTQSVRCSEGAAACEILTYAEVPGESYLAVIVPQAAALTLTVETEDGVERSVSFEENEFLQGKYYTVSLVVESDRLVPTLSGEVSDWVSGGALTPQNPGGGGEDGGQGGDGGTDSDSMICMGDTYPTVKISNQIWMAENLHYVPTGSTGWWYPDENPANVETYGVLYDFDTAQQFCPEGWRLPTENDFETLIELLEEPYEDFVPLAGIYTKSADRVTNFGVKGNLMGSTVGATSNLRKYLQLNTSTGVSLTIQEAQVANGVSVRYVKDAL